MLIKAKDLQVGDKLSGYEITKVTPTEYGLWLFQFKGGGMKGDSLIPCELEINVERTRNIEVPEELLKYVICFLMGNDMCKTANALEELLENSTTKH